MPKRAGQFRSEIFEGDNVAKASLPYLQMSYDMKDCATRSLVKAQVDAHNFYTPSSRLPSRSTADGLLRNGLLKTINVAQKKHS